MTTASTEDQEDDALVLDDPRKADEVTIQRQKDGGDPAGQRSEEPPSQQPQGKKSGYIGQGKRQARRCLIQMAGQRIDHRRQHDLSGAVVAIEEHFVLTLDHGGGAQGRAYLIALELGITQVDQAEETAGEQEDEEAGDEPGG